MSLLNPWGELADLRAAKSSLERQLKEMAKSRDWHQTAAGVFQKANHKLIEDLHRTECELNEARNIMATMHRRDPTTGRLLPKGT